MMFSDDTYALASGGSDAVLSGLPIILEHLRCGIYHGLLGGDF